MTDQVDTVGRMIAEMTVSRPSSSSNIGVGYSGTAMSDFYTSDQVDTVGRMVAQMAVSSTNSFGRRMAGQAKENTEMNGVSSDVVPIEESHVLVKKDRTITSLDDSCINSLAPVYRTSFHTALLDIGANRRHNICHVCGFRSTHDFLHKLHMKQHTNNNVMSLQGRHKGLPALCIALSSRTNFKVHKYLPVGRIRLNKNDEILHKVTQEIIMEYMDETFSCSKCSFKCRGHRQFIVHLLNCHKTK